MAARKVNMFVLCVHIYVLPIKLRCGVFNENNTDLKKNIFNTVGFIDCIKLLRFQNRLYHQTEKSIHSSALFLFLLLACGDIEGYPGSVKAEKGFSIYQQNTKFARDLEQQRSFGTFYKSEEYQNIWYHRNSAIV